MADSIIGSSNRPELVADCPCTNCWYWGRKVMPPNITNPATKPSPVASEKFMFLNSRSGRIGCSARPRGAGFTFTVLDPDDNDVIGCRTSADAAKGRCARRSFLPNSPRGYGPSR